MCLAIYIYRVAAFRVCRYTAQKLFLFSTHFSGPSIRSHTLPHTHTMYVYIRYTCIIRRKLLLQLVYCLYTLYISSRAYVYNHQLFIYRLFSWYTYSIRRGIKFFRMKYNATTWLFAYA